MKTIFLTGAAGFIGSNTAQALLKAGYRVLGFDNFAPVYSREKKEDNLRQVQASAPKEGAFVFFEGDLRNPQDLRHALSSHPVDGIIHLAALAGVQPSLKEPELYWQVNVLGTSHLFEIAKSMGIKAIVAASSSSVYGKNEKLPFSEQDFVDHPISPYAASKKAGELMAHTYHHLYGLSVACLRFFTVYGPRQRPDLAIYKFTRAMLKGEAITLYGDGSSSRDYTFIDDCVQGILQALAWVEKGVQGDPRFGVFNLGESQQVKLSRLVELLEENLKVKAKRQYADYLPGDVFATYADLSLSQRELGYSPKTKIESGIEKFCQWYLTQEKDKSWAS